MKNRDATPLVSLPSLDLGMNSLEDALRFLAPDETARAYLDRALAEPIASGIPWMDDDPEPALRAGELIEIVGAGGGDRLRREIRPVARPAGAE